jgi:2-hydroxychromene-2-carboxylate isomerase
MKIEYYYGTPSPFAYLGSARFQSITKKYNAEIVEKPCDLVGGMFVKTGGISVPQRSLQRQKYRLDEIERWSKFLNIKTNIKPKFFSLKDPHIPAKFTIADNLLGIKVLFGHELLKQLWSDEKDISDEKNIKIVSNSFEIDFKELSTLATSEKVSKIYSDNTEEAVEKNVFGAPTYIFNNELFGGQDRLEFLERALKNA